MWFTGINYYKLAAEKYRDSIFTTITTIWKPCFRISSCELLHTVFLHTVLPRETTNREQQFHDLERLNGGIASLLYTNMNDYVLEQILSINECN
jgi:hypothetical protein